MPGISLTDSIEISRRIKKTLRAFPEISDVTIKIGRQISQPRRWGSTKATLILPCAQWNQLIF
jgi:Cu/Ag efflux pump CusA